MLAITLAFSEAPRFTILLKILFIKNVKSVLHAIEIINMKIEFTDKYCNYHTHDKDTLCVSFQFNFVIL